MGFNVSAAPGWLAQVWRKTKRIAYVAWRILYYYRRPLAAALAVVIVLVGYSALFYHWGYQRGYQKTTPVQAAVATLPAQAKAGTKPVTTGSLAGTSSNGQFRLTGLVMAVTANGIVLQTPAGNLATILVDDQTVYQFHQDEGEGRSGVSVGDAINAVCRVQAQGQFTAVVIEFL